MLAWEDDDDDGDEMNIDAGAQSVPGTARPRDEDTDIGAAVSAESAVPPDRTDSFAADSAWRRT